MTPSMFSPQGRIAVVHEWLDSRAGSEQVFENLAATFPSADLFALTVDPDVDFNLDRPVTTTFLQRSNLTRTTRHLTLMAMPAAWRLLGNQDYDLVISSSHAFARYFPNRGGLHFSYTHAPMRYAWTPMLDQRASGLLLGPARAAMRWADRRTVDRVTSFAANSTVVASRIREFYGRDSVTIPPPVEVERFLRQRSGRRDSFILGFSRWVPYKRLDLVVRVGEAIGRPVVIAGRGPGGDQLGQIAATATVPVDLVENPDDALVQELYERAAAVVFPAIEDFGIVPVEAQAAGTPVVVVKGSGACDGVLAGATGVIAPDQSVAALSKSTELALALPEPDDRWRTHVEQFAPVNFRAAVKDWVKNRAT